MAILATKKQTYNQYKRWRKEIGRRIRKLKGIKEKDITGLLKSMKKFS